MKKVIGLLSLCVFHAYAGIQRSSTPDQLQSLYKQITNELMCIRKEFTQAQPRVYTILDQMDRMNNLAKNIYQKKQTLEFQVTNVSSNFKKIQDENKALKTEVPSLKQKLYVTTKCLEQINKQFEHEKQRATKRSKEKKDLQGKISQIENEKNIKELNEKIEEKVNKTVEAEVTAQFKNLSADQSLSRNSTSAPSSPR